MAPRKVKSQAKRNNFKIKSKVSSQKRGMKPMKKTKGSEKPLENLKWLNKGPNEKIIKKCNGGPGWLENGGLKRMLARRSPEGNDSDYWDYPVKDGEEKSTASDMSDECNCSHSKYSENKGGGILKRKSSSTSSLVAKYIKSGMDHVASFIVESAIRFGEKHGVVIPDKNIPNVYEITPPDKFDERFRKIRFQIPNKTLGYEDAKKAMWRSYDKDPENVRVGTSMGDWDTTRAGSPGKGSPDSLEEILPLLEDLKEGEEITGSEVDENNLKADAEHVRNLDRKLKERSMERKADRSLERKMDRKMDRNMERSAERNPDRKIDRNVDRNMDRNMDRKFTRSLERSMDRKLDRSLERNADRPVDRKGERSRERNMERNIDRDVERDKERDRGRNRERLREKLRSLGKRFKSLGAANKEDEETEYALKDNSTWKKFRRDSLELGRQRLRASTCPRKPESRSQSPY